MKKLINENLSTAKSRLMELASISLNEGTGIPELDAFLQPIETVIKKENTPFRLILTGDQGYEDLGEFTDVYDAFNQEFERAEQASGIDPKENPEDITQLLPNKFKTVELSHDDSILVGAEIPIFEEGYPYIILYDVPEDFDVSKLSDDVEAV